jgi:phage shock protein E
MNRLHRIIVSLIAPALLFGCSTGSESTLKPGADEVTIAWQKVQEGALLVDVRTPAEFNTGHLEEAVNVPLEEINTRLSEFGDDMDREIVVYCRSGRRSGLAAGILEASGYTSVSNGGGYALLKERRP